MLLGKTLDRNMSSRPNSSQNIETKPVASLIKQRYSYYLNILKGYVRYSQMSESKSKLQVTEDINKIADKLIAKYHFGSQFMHEIHRYINQRYVTPASQVYEQMQAESGLDDSTFSRLSNELSRDFVFSHFSPRFRTVFD